MQGGQTVLECRNVYKSFQKNRVLQDINLKIERGTVHALLGQNGAGKSTLVKIITGVYTLDSGELFFHGEPVRIHSPHDAEQLGIAIIHQDQQLVPYFDVTRNAFLGSELTTRAGALDFAAMRSLVEQQLAYIHADFTADRQIGSLTVGQREQVAIVSALIKNPKLLILDEPTASLSAKEITRLFEIIRILRDKGVTIIYISHHLDEVFDITDTITVLRDSRSQGTYPTASMTHEKIVTLMIGRELKDFYPKEPAPIGNVVLEVKDLRQGKMVKGLSFQLRRGEILGFAGLVGAGRTESMLTIYGAQRHFTGEILLDGKPYKPVSPGKACRAGFALIPEDRRGEGIVADLTISENLSLAYTRSWARLGIIRRIVEKSVCTDLIQALSIKCTSLVQKARDLSGGNQQKVVIGKWMAGDATVYIFDQPTTGVDVGAKTEIYRHMMHLAQKGCGVIFISSENEELLGICDRILVMSKGRVVMEAKAAELTEQDLLYWSSSGEEPGKAAGGETA